MNKQEFATELAERANLTKASAKAITDHALDILMECLEKRESVKFVGFGTFDVRKTSARVMRNPQTREAVSVPEGYKPVFKAGAELKRKVAQD